MTLAKPASQLCVPCAHRGRVGQVDMETYTCVRCGTVPTPPDMPPPSLPRFERCVQVRSKDKGFFWEW